MPDQYWGLHFICIKFTFSVQVCNSSTAWLLPSHLLQKRQAYWKLFITANLCTFNNWAIREPPPPPSSSKQRCLNSNMTSGWPINCTDTRNKLFLIDTTCLRIVWFTNILKMLVSEGKSQKSIMYHPDENSTWGAWRTKFFWMNKSKCTVIELRISFLLYTMTWTSNTDRLLAFPDNKSWNCSTYVSGFCDNGHRTVI